MPQDLNSRIRKNVIGRLIAACVILFAAGPALATDEPVSQAKPAVTIPPAMECSSCTRRHQALVKARKQRGEKQPAPADESERVKPTSPEE